MAMQLQPGDMQTDDATVDSSAAALARYLKLQQFQSDYLAWLQASEKHPDMDPYFYREIR